MDSPSKNDSMIPVSLKAFVKEIMYRGSQRFCSVCGKSARIFKTYGTIPRKDAICPFCGAFERHRLLMNFLRFKTDLFTGSPKAFLHVAPEPAFIPLFQQVAGDGYLTADLLKPDVKEKMDITDIRHPDNSFDVIVCSHVLEHVEDDRKAMRELCRVLKTTGWAILNVPITATLTFEDPSITDPEERQRVYGQFDHVRNYGPDYQQRLKDAGFAVVVIRPEDLLSSGDIERQGLGGSGAGEIFYCTKSSADHPEE
jgi:SAM-dependent methyltransferase